MDSKLTYSRLVVRLLTVSACLSLSAMVHALPAAQEVAVCAFTGTDRQMASVVTETILTDLAQSSSITVYDIRESNSLPAGARYKVVGSCLTLDSAVVISARIVDVRTGGTLPGAAGRVTGTREKALSLIAELSDRLIGALTGTPPTSSSMAERPSPKPLGGVGAPSPVVLGAAPTLDPTLGDGSRLGDSQADREPHSNANTNRDIDDSRGRRDESDAPEGRSRHDTHERFTSLIIDTRGLDIERSMSPRIRRTDGSVVWAGADASPDFVIDKGIVVYTKSMREAERHPRAGSNPMVVRAEGRYRDNFRSDPLILDSDAEALLDFARKDGFLKKFNVIFLID